MITAIVMNLLVSYFAFDNIGFRQAVIVIVLTLLAIIWDICLTIKLIQWVIGA
jgi:hypothetical protein